jgi:hypothetical protein
MMHRKQIPPYKDDGQHEPYCTAKGQWERDKSGGERPTQKNAVSFFQFQALGLTMYGVRTEQMIPTTLLLINKL